MKNNRKIEVGQVRMVKGCPDSSNTYVVLAGDNVEVQVMWLNGKLKGYKQFWSTHHLHSDVVVM
ncbi:hypothetical protein VPH184E373B_0109 [Vibrio phage 184E37-3b]|nr:hypothetical protein MYOV056v2_p0095 [Vibrio phage 184E37.3a]